ncbi:DinB family protein [Chitinophagaceae bacterium MMS25-I14]
METSVQLVVNMALQAWESNLKRASAVFAGLSDEQLMEEVSPGRNRGVYLLGHLVVVHDMMLPLLGIGARNYPHLDTAFISSPDKSVAEIPSVQELREHWATLNTQIHEKFSGLQPEEWLYKHTAVSEEDFAKEPHRNRLNVLLSRTNHLNYHLGQVILIKK